MESFSKTVTLVIISKHNSEVIDLGSISNIDLSAGDDPRYLGSMATYFCQVYPPDKEFLITYDLVDKLYNKFIIKLGTDFANEQNAYYVIYSKLKDSIYKQAKILLSDEG